MRHLYAQYKYFVAKTVNLALIVAIVASFSAWAAKAHAHDEEVAAQIAEAQRAATRGPYAIDGVFEGAAQGYGGLVRMSVTIENGYIEKVDIVDASSEDDAWLEMAVVLPDQIVKAQTTDIDTISGATLTSAGILNATAEALNKSIRG